MPHWSRRELSIGRLFRPFSLLLGARYAHNFVSKSTDCSRKNGSQTMPSEASIFPKNPIKRLYFTWRYIMCVWGLQCTVGTEMDVWIWSESEEDELKLWWERSEYARTWHLTAALKFQWRLRRGYFETISEPALVPNRCWDQRMELFSNLINSKINRN